MSKVIFTHRNGRREPMGENYAKVLQKLKRGHYITKVMTPAPEQDIAPEEQPSEAEAPQETQAEPEQKRRGRKSKTGK